MMIHRIRSRFYPFWKTSSKKRIREKEAYYEILLISELGQIPAFQLHRKVLCSCNSIVNKYM